MQQMDICEREREVNSKMGNGWLVDQGNLGKKLGKKRIAIFSYPFL